MQQSAVRPQGEALRQLILALIAPYLLPEIGSPDCRSDAALLNEQDVRTTTGREWTRHNLRIFLGKEHTAA